MKNTQCGLILQHMQQGKSITPLEALDKFGCFRLASRISDLNKSGHNIVKEMVSGANGKRYAKYYLYAK